MDPTPEQRQAFGSLLRSLRRERGMSARALAAALPAREDGTTWTHASITGWERGEFAPRSVETIRRLEDILTAPPGCLFMALGVSAATARGVWGHPAVDAEFQDLLRRLAGDDSDGSAASVLHYLLNRVRILEGRLDELDRTLGVTIAADDYDFAIAAEGAGDASEQKVGKQVNRPSPEPEPEGP